MSNGTVPSIPVPAVTPPLPPSHPQMALPAQLDNPPRTRVISTGIPPIASIGVPITPPSFPATLTSLGFVDLLNMRAALQARLDLLVKDPANNAIHINATKAMLTVVQQQLTAKTPPTTVPPLMPHLPAAAARGVILPVNPPPTVPS